MAAKRTAPGPALSLPEPSKNTGFTPELGRQIVANLDRGLMDGDTALLCGVHKQKHSSAKTSSSELFHTSLNSFSLFFISFFLKLYTFCNKLFF